MSSHSSDERGKEREHVLIEELQEFTVAQAQRFQGAMEGGVVEGRPGAAQSDMVANR